MTRRTQKTKVSSHNSHAPYSGVVSQCRTAEDGQNHRHVMLNVMPTIGCTTMRNKCTSRFQMGYNHTRDLLQVMTATRTSRPAHLALLLFLLLLSPSLSSSKAALHTRHSGAARNSPNRQQAKHDPFNIYLHKLSLFLPKQNESKGASEIEQTTPLFDNVVNATSHDYLMTSQQLNHSKVAQVINTTHFSSLLQFNCQGSDCPKAELLQQKSSSFELQSSGSEEFRPKVLPQWKDRPRRVIRSSDEYVNEDSEGTNSVSGKLGPLRIFKYIHHPDDLLSKAEPPTANSTQPTESDWGNPEFTDNQYEEAKSTQRENSIEREATTDRSLIPNSYFKRNSSEEVKLQPNETTAIVINGTLDPDGFRLRRSPFRPHWRDHRLYTHDREALYQIQSPANLHPPPPGMSAMAVPMQHNSFNMPQNTMPMQQNNLEMQQNSFGMQQNSGGYQPNSFNIQQNSGGMQPNSGMARQEYISMTNQPVSLVTIPVAVPVALPFTNNGIQTVNQVASDRTFSTSATVPDPQALQEQSTFRFSKFQNPYSHKRPHRHEKRPVHGRRRPPQPPRPRGRPGNGPVPSVMPPPKPIPLPRPRPQIQFAPSGRHHGSVRRPPPPNSFAPTPASAPARPPQTVPYSYPKHAANIQDILTFFKTEENDNEIPETDVKPSIGSSSVPPLNSGSGLSSEFRDIQTSLLKDIKDFAKRPSMLRESEERGRGSIPVPSPLPSVLPLIDPEDPLDEIFSPKPKPVREMIRYSRERETSTEQSSNAFAPSTPDYSKSSSNNGLKGNGGSKNRGRYEDDRRNSYYDEDGDDRKSQRNRHEPSHASKVRDKNNMGRPENEYSKEEEDNYRSRHRDRHAPKNGQTHQHDRYEPHQNSNKHQQSFYKNYQDYKKSEDGFRSDERPYSDNQYRPSSNNYQQQERDESGDRDYDNHTPQYKKSPAKARRPHKARQQRPHRRNRHKNRDYGGSNVNERYRSRHREREAASRERPRQHSSEFMQSPTNKVKATMEQAYYQQRNRPIVIKRPYQPYRPVDAHKVEQQRKQQDQYWNTVGTVNQPNTKAAPSARPATIQKHYHYYGVGSPVSVSSTPVTSNSLVRLNPHDPTMPTSTRRPMREGNISPEEDILEIHTGSGLSDVSTTPVYPVGGQQSVYPTDYDKSARLQKMYMEYLQRKLEAEAESQSNAMLPSPTPVTSTSRPKRPMRMKIHIYPNEKVHVVDQNNNHNIYPLNHHNTHHSSQYNTYQGSQYNTPQSPQHNTHHSPHHHNSQHSTHSLFGHSSSNVYNPGTAGSINVHRSYGHYQTPSHSVGPSVIHASSQPSQPMGNNLHGRPPGSTVDKNKNLVLHLHVHRRNGETIDGQMDMAGSETVTSTVKPLTYEDIYQTSNSDTMQMAENSRNDAEQDQADQSPDVQKKQDDRQNDEIMDSDKSLSMELPIHQDKIEDVLSTLLKLRD